MYQYNVASRDANEFIADEEIRSSLNEAVKLAQDKDYVAGLLAKAREYKGLSHRKRLFY